MYQSNSNRCKLNMFIIAVFSYFWSNYDGPRTEVFAHFVVGSLKSVIATGSLIPRYLFWPIKKSSYL